MNEYKRLRLERKELRGLITELENKAIELKNNKNGQRRQVAEMLCKIGTDAHNTYAVPMLLRAAIEVLSYNDDLACMMIENAINFDYKRMIRKAKKEK